MIDLSSPLARSVIDAPADAPLLTLVGPAASGKSTLLARRYLALVAQAGSDAVIVSAARANGARALGERIAAFDGAAGPFVGAPLEDVAIEILREQGLRAGLALDIEIIDEVDAEEIFERAAAPLFALEWTEFISAEIDPEIPGLRAPERFAAAALRLIRKLRDAQISPDDFLSAALRGSNAFYAKPPNFANPSLLFATKDIYRDSLSIGPQELERQRRRELDLAKIIAKLYRAYLDELNAHGCLTATDAIAEAIRILGGDASLARMVRNRFRFALVDDVHDLRTGELRLLQAMFGKDLIGVTFAGDPDAATDTFAGARPERTFALGGTTIALAAGGRVPAQIAAAARAMIAEDFATALPDGGAIVVHRASDQVAEAAFVADRVASLINGGTPPEQIAVLSRSLRTIAPYEAALLDRNVPIDLIGDDQLFAHHDTQDALAMLWSVADPFRHDWLLRTLESPAVRLSDASLAVLCGDPPNPQALLFELPAIEESDRSNRRWDKRRDLRLATNVLRADRDGDLTDDARERLQSFRARRARWVALRAHTPLSRLVRTIVAESGIVERRSGEPSARHAQRIARISSLLERIERFAVRRPDDALLDAVLYCERIAESETPLSVPGTGRAGFVTLAAIDAVKTRRFAHVFILDARAGAFPPYYVPDAFLFSPQFGMIPKDNVGEASAARTAKFTWYLHQAKLRDAYAREDRRRLACAMVRADETVTVSTSGRPTRAVAAPEFLVELQSLRPAPIVAERTTRTVAVETGATRELPALDPFEPPMRVLVPGEPDERFEAVFLASLASPGAFDPSESAPPIWRIARQR